MILFCPLRHQTPGTSQFLSRSTAERSEPCLEKGQGDDDALLTQDPGRRILRPDLVTPDPIERAK